MEQKLKFKELYDECRTEVKETLTSMWTEGFKESNGYKNEIAEAVENIFAPSTTMPVVQSMFPWEPMDNNNGQALTEVEKLVKWKETYLPYKHQYECWEALLNKKKSICVTTGTGSGKTECFMYPIIKDIADNRDTRTGVQAIFLYPLNALADDQKDRLNKLLDNVDPDKNIKFAVYNGNTPESLRERDNDDNTVTDDGTVGTTGKKTYSHELTTREAIRTTPPAILVTNPTMLEYMMLRKDDKSLLEGNLKWFVIDETHTFKGAAAAELAMLIRRVLMAFNIDAKNVQFATSSATTGTGGDKELKKFIADISWRQPDDIEVVSGKRVLGDKLTLQDNLQIRENLSLSKERQNEIANLLLNKDFVRLDDLIQEDSEISDKLEILDKLCEEVGIMAKMHFFFQAPSFGLSTRLCDIKDGKFKILNQHKSDDENNPLLELVRCKHCGNILARAVVSEKDDGSYSYKRIKRENTEAFEMANNPDDDSYVDDQDTDSTDGSSSSPGFPKKGKVWLFAPAMAEEGNCKVGEDGSTIETGGYGWGNIIHSEDKKCPCCGNKVVKAKDSSNNEMHDTDAETTYLQPLCAGPMFFSRILAKRLLKQMTPAEEQPGEHPHQGQQYISFVDNRQAAATLTLDQTKDVEEQWLQSRVYKLLSNLGLTAEEQEELKNLYDKRNLTTSEERTRRDYLEGKENATYLSWNDLHKRLIDEYENEVDLLVEQSLKKKERDNDSNFNKYRYIMTLMYEQLGSRKPTKDSLETLGMVQTYYPKLEGINWDNVCSSGPFKEFNDKYCPNEPIPQNEWKNLVRIYIDYTLRSDASVYYQNTADSRELVWDNISIMQFRRFASKKDNRRPAQKLGENNEDGNIIGLRSRFAKLLRTVADKDIEDEDLVAVLKKIPAILKENRILKGGTWFLDKLGQVRFEENDSFRMNIEDMAFKLYDEAWLCPKTNRILPYTFMGYSPYLWDGSTPEKAKKIDNWDKFDFSPQTENEIKAWCAKHRKELGNISNRTARMFLPNYPLYVSAEHTAQVDKENLEEHQEKFKQHDINVLTCSTTMEMGVDLGDLELVVMNSIPPHPANYKQRAGRSGRKSQNKSAAITFCGSDSVGKLTMADSMTNLITRSYDTPKVDFNSQQIIQRHVNSFLLRACDGIEQLGDRLYELFAEEGMDFGVHPATGVNNQVVVKYERSLKSPLFELGDKNKTRFEQLKKNLTGKQESFKEGVTRLLSGTNWEEDTSLVISKAVTMFEDVYAELKEEFKHISDSWKSRANNVGLENPEVILTGYLDDKGLRAINHQYVGLMKESLLGYLATHQLTPNAAMPIDIVEFDTQEENYSFSRTKRPSYSLARALSQYAPGRLVVLNNVCYRSAGVDWRDRFNQATRGIRTVGQNPDGQIELDVNTNILYTMIEPKSFKTDINEEESRISDGQIYTHTEAYLIGNANCNWQTIQESNLVQFRNPTDDPHHGERTPEILFLNTGKNNLGYCVCLGCGKAEMETVKADASTPPPASFLNIDKNGKEYHKNISVSYKQMAKSKQKSNLHYNNDSTLRRNVVFGGTIQTDYCELKFWHSSDNKNTEFAPRKEAEGNSNQDMQILHTLGVLICKYMSDILGIERGEIDYLITTNGTLCIYDLAKGGAGYSKKLHDGTELLRCLDNIREDLLATNAHGEYNLKADSLIDSFTVFNEDEINLSATRDWLVAEKAQRTPIPDSIQKAINGAEVYIVDGLKSKMRDAAKAGEDIVMFADWVTIDGYEQFDKENFYGWYKECNPEHTKLCFLNYDSKSIPPYDNLKKSEVRCKLYKVTDSGSLPNDVYPLAIINNRLYLTDKRDATAYSDKWGNSAVFSVDASEITFQEELLQVSYPKNLDKFILNKGLNIKSSELLTKLSEQVNGDMISQFIKSHQGQDTTITYIDEHVKSPLAMSIAVHVVKSVIDNLHTSSVKAAFIMEEYEDKNGQEGVMWKNMPDSESRDKYFNDLCSDLDCVHSILSMPKKNLPHWRVLIINVGKDTMAIYPNGGFANGWQISRSNTKYYDADELTSADDISIYLSEDIMFDVQIL